LHGAADHETADAEGPQPFLEIATLSANSSVVSSGQFFHSHKLGSQPTEISPSGKRACRSILPSMLLKSQHVLWTIYFWRTTTLAAQKALPAQEKTPAHGPATSRGRAWVPLARSISVDGAHAAQCFSAAKDSTRA